MWISFLPGIGVDSDPPPPSLDNIEEHINNPSPMEIEWYKAKPLVFAAFSISASEPRMMVVRNLVGKLMAWCNDQKIFLKPRSWQDAWTLIQKDRQIRLIDMLQDEKNRVGCYALWDSFTDLVNNADLKFIENLAEQMTNMSADDEALAWTKNWSKENVTKHILDKLKEHIPEKNFEGIKLKMEKKFNLSGENLVRLFQDEEEERRKTKDPSSIFFRNRQSQGTDESQPTAQDSGRLETLLHMIEITVSLMRPFFLCSSISPPALSSSERRSKSNFLATLLFF